MPILHNELSTSLETARPGEIRIADIVALTRSTRLRRGLPHREVLDCYLCSAWAFIDFSRERPSWTITAYSALNLFCTLFRDIHTCIYHDRGRSTGTEEYLLTCSASGRSETPA